MMEKLSSEVLEEKKKYFDENYADIQERIQRAAAKSSRKPEEITLLAATKTLHPQMINYAIERGICFIGENRVQEYLSKYDDLNLEGTEKHFIGHLQTNKVKMIADKVAMIESVHSVKLAKCIGELCVPLHKTMDILLEVNVGNEESKSGFMPKEILDAVREIAQIKGVHIKGLMAIPPICESKAEIRKYFAQMYKLFIDIRGKNIDNSNMVCLSMGMSDDFDIAIEEGANIVRIGTALFGKRLYR